MPLLTNPEPIPTKLLTFILVIENSKAMQGLKLETLNIALENYISLLQYYAAMNVEAQIKVAVLTFSDKAQWITEKPICVEQYVWMPILENNDTKVSFSSVFNELNQKLSKNVFMGSSTGALPPVIMFFTASYCSNDSIFNDSFENLSKNNWNKNALKVAFAIGKTADKITLEKWTEIPELTLAIKAPETLLEYVNIAGRLCAEIAMNSGYISRRESLKESLEKILNNIVYEISEYKRIENSSIINNSCSFVQFDDKNISEIAVNYKTNIAKNFVSINPGHIDDRIGGKKFYITRKYDGELAVLSWNGNSLVAANSSGKLFKDFPCIQQTKEQLKKTGIKSLVFAAELYCEESKGRSRVSDCTSAIANNQSVLRLAPFDIISLEEKPYNNIQYNEIYKKLKNIFDENEYCKPVKYIEAKTKAEIEHIFNEWVEKENSEGLVIRSELPVIYKLKPKITVDVVIAGFSESSEVKGQVRTLLYALRNEEGKYQIIGRVGNGLTNEQRKDLFSRLMSMKISSNYLEIDSNRLAFHMIRPEIVIELSIGEIIYETVSGNIKNPILEYDENVIKQTGTCAGYSFISSVIERFREDKTNRISDISITQISERVPIKADNKITQDDNMPKSSILRRDIWTKGNAVQKLLVWKTNKEKYGFPAFSASWTIFNPDLKDPFKVEMRISSSEAQINQLASQFIGKNINTSTWKERL